jgi:hypothetical protein
MGNIQHVLGRQKLYPLFVPQSLKNMVVPQRYRKLLLVIILMTAAAWGLLIYRVRTEGSITPPVNLVSKITPLVSKPHLTYLPFTHVRYNWKLAQLEVDGNGRDWKYFSPQVSDPMGDTTDDLHSDLKAIYIEQDARYAYIMIESYDPPFLSAANDAMIEIYMYLADENGYARVLFGYIQPNGTFNAWIDQNGDGSLDEALKIDELVAWGDVVEVRLPLDQLDSPTYIGSPYLSFVCTASSGKLAFVDEISFLNQVSLTTGEPGSAVASVPVGIGGIPSGDLGVLKPGSTP